MGIHGTMLVGEMYIGMTLDCAITMATGGTLIRAELIFRQLQL